MSQGPGCAWGEESQSPETHSSQMLWGVWDLYLVSTGHFSQVLVLVCPSHLTPSFPQDEGCNQTARAGLEGQDAHSDGGESTEVPWMQKVALVSGAVR